jgi:hypothetical protein
MMNNGWYQVTARWLLGIETTDELASIHDDFAHSMLKGGRKSIFCSRKEETPANI